MAVQIKHYDGSRTPTVPRPGEYVDAAPVAGQQSGRWYSTGGPNANTLVLVNDRLYLCPIIIHRRRAPQAIGINVGTAGSVGALLRFGIYLDNDGTPSTVAVQAGTVSGEATGTPQIIINTPLEPGMYWLGIASQGAPTTPPTVRAISGIGNPLVGLNATGNLGASGYYSTATISGAFPALGASLADAPISPSVLLKM